MIVLDRSQEREEKKRIGGGTKLGIVSLLLSWIPLLGVLLSSISFIRVMGSITERHKKKQRVGLIVGSIALVLSLALTTGELYTYTHYPWVVSDWRDQIMMALTGDTCYYGSTSYDYTDQINPSMGMSNDLYSRNYTAQGYYDEQGNFVPYQSGETPVVGSDETGG